MKTKLSSEIELALSDVVAELESYPEIQMYNVLQKNISEDTQLQQLWSEKKIIQQELIQAKQYHLEKQQQHLTAMLNAVNCKLENHPLVHAYNDIHAQITNIQKEIEEIVFSEK